MSKKKNMHYLSQCITKNFAPKDSNKTFWQYDCAVKGPLQQRNVSKLFSSKHTWSQEFEDILSSNHYENVLGPLLRKLCDKEVKKGFIIGPNKIETFQFNAEQITDSGEIKLLNRLFLQTLLMQKSNNKECAPDDILSEIFQNELNLGMNLLLVEINPWGKYPPLILTDGMLFFTLAPDKSKDSIGHMNFFFPINENRFILWTSTKDDYTFFAKQYQDINFLNLCRIEQHGKKCRIASFNKKYLENLIPLIENFSSNMAPEIIINRI